MIYPWKNYQNLREAPENLWKGFPQVRGKKVFVKPNLVVPSILWEKASCTRVEVIEIVLSMLKDGGCSDITVGDCGFKDQWGLTLSSSGFDVLPRRYGIKLIGLMNGKNYHKFSLKRLDNYMSLFGAKISDYVLESDLIINVPKLKVHKMAYVTGAIKNMMGVMIQKGSMHPKGNREVLHKRLHDLYFLIRDKVGFCIMDGVEGSEYAEQGGVSKKANVLISTRDMWTMDVEASTVIGIPPGEVLYLEYIRRSLNRDFPSIGLQEDLITPFERPLGYREI
jgi:uncharacterized protein (DUF362 family)